MSEHSKLLFIVGVPRSGTTLLRELLAAHSKITMPRVEFQLLPYLMRKYPKGHIFLEKDVDPLKRIIRNSPFYFYLRHEVSLSQFSPEGCSFESMVKTLLAHYSPQDEIVGAEWLGEKTPNNLFSVEEIIDRFPCSKFVHIVRDPRDVALSMHKAFGKSLISSAVAWERGIKCAIGFKSKWPDRIIEVKYEDLTKNPEAELRKISEFLGLDFEVSMCELREAREKIGDAAGYSKIKRANTDKYMSRMLEKDRIWFASYLKELLKLYRYPSNNAVERVEINPCKLQIQKYIDFLRSFSRHIKEKGVVAGVCYRARQARYK